MNGILYSDPSTLILDLPHGKPDPMVPFPKDGPDTRPRVFQSPQKGPNCIFYAMNMLRCRIGPLAGPGREGARKIEKACSTVRKKETALSMTWDKGMSFVLDYLREKKIPLNREAIKKIMPELAGIVLIHKQLEVLEILQDFCAQSEEDSFEAYSKKRRSSLEGDIYRTFFNTLGVSPEEAYDEIALSPARCCLQIVYCGGIFFGLNPTRKEIRETLGRDFKAICPTWIEYIRAKGSESIALQSIYPMVAKDKFGFLKSSWMPKDDIKKLTECLASEGPLLVEGVYGTARYTKSPTRFKEAKDAPALIPPIFVWKPSDRCKDITLGHAIVVVGTRTIKDQGYVCFVDPTDGSDPANLLQRKTYMISYQNFIENIVDRRGLQIVGKNSPFGYASYFPKEKR